MLAYIIYFIYNNIIYTIAYMILYIETIAFHIIHNIEFMLSLSFVQSTNLWFK